MASHESDASGRQLSLFTIGHDPLMMILDQIPIMERIRMERLCRSAGSVVAASLRRVTQLDFSEFAQKKREGYTNGYYPVLSGILRRFREHVRSMKFCKAEDFNYDTTKVILSALIQFQPFNQLQKLYIGGFTMYNRSPIYNQSMKEGKEYESVKMLRQLFTHPRMISLRVLDCGYEVPTIPRDPEFSKEFQFKQCNNFPHIPCIQSVLKNCRNLVEFKLHYCRGLELEGLFPESLESIEFMNCDLTGARRSWNGCFEMEKLFGMRMPSLQRIVIGTHKGRMSFGPDFAQTFPSLKVLKVLNMGREPFGFFGDLKGILETEVKQLSLRGGDSLSSAMESLLIDLRASPHSCRLLQTLNILHLPGFRRFSSKTAEMIRLSSNLEELSLKSSSYETVPIDSMFQALPNLTTLNVSHCWSRIVRDSTLETIGVFCPRIKYLNVSGCMQVTNAMIQSMIEALAANPDRAQTEELKINVKLTGISLESSGPIKFICI